MQVQVVLDPGAGGPAEIEADIVPVGMIFLPQGVLALAAQIHHFMQFPGFGFAKRGDVAMGNHEQMAGSIREEIENNEGMPAAKKQ